MSCFLDILLLKCPVALPYGALWDGLQFVTVVFPDHTHVRLMCLYLLVLWVSFDLQIISALGLHVSFPWYHGLSACCYGEVYRHISLLSHFTNHYYISKR